MGDFEATPEPQRQPDHTPEDGEKVQRLAQGEEVWPLDRCLDHPRELGYVDVEGFKRWVSCNPGAVSQLIISLFDALPIDAIRPAVLEALEANTGRNATQPPHHDRGEWAIPELHGLSDAADYLARNPGDEYAQRRFRERMAQLTAALTEAKQQGPGEAQVYDILRATLSSRNTRSDGDVLALALRCQHLAAEDAQVIEMQRGNYAEFNRRYEALTAPQVEAKRQAGEGK